MVRSKKFGKVVEEFGNFPNLVRALQSTSTIQYIVVICTMMCSHNPQTIVLQKNQLYKFVFKNISPLLTSGLCSARPVSTWNSNYTLTIILHFLYKFILVRRTIQDCKAGGEVETVGINRCPRPKPPRRRPTFHPPASPTEY